MGQWAAESRVTPLLHPWAGTSISECCCQGQFFKQTLFSFCSASNKKKQWIVFFFQPLKWRVGYIRWESWWPQDNLERKIPQCICSRCIRRHWALPIILHIWVPRVYQAVWKIKPSCQWVNHLMRNEMKWASLLSIRNTLLRNRSLEIETFKDKQIKSGPGPIGTGHWDFTNSITTRHVCHLQDPTCKFTLPSNHSDPLVCAILHHSESEEGLSTLAHTPWPLLSWVSGGSFPQHLDCVDL